MQRPSGRRPEQLRAVRITRRYLRHAEGSVLVEFGDTRVICTASIDRGVPRFLLAIDGRISVSAYGTGGYLEAVAGKSSMTVTPSPDAYAVETHPLVIRHPRTGRAALYANSVYTTGIEGMDADEARSLLARLTAHATHPNFTCRLRWEPQMLTIWDNNATQHFAINDYPGERRELFRTSVAGTEPQPA